MLKTWALYSVSLISSFIFFLCYKMWVSWILLVVIAAVPFFALIMSIVASKTMKFKAECPSNVLIGTPVSSALRQRGLPPISHSAKSG